MSDDRTQRLNDLFIQALDVPRVDRATWLDENCHGDEELRREVQELLDVDNPSHDPLEAGIAGLVERMEKSSVSCPQCNTIWDVEETVVAEELCCPSCSHQFQRSNCDTPQLAQKKNVGNDLNRRADDESSDDADDESPSSRGVRFGDYELLHEIARGGMGVVYKARQTKLNRFVALKMIKSGEFAGPDEIVRFRIEAEAAAGLDHPHIVPIFDVGEVVIGDSEPGMGKSLHYYSMALVDGGSLSTRLRNGPLSPRLAAALVSKIADAVQYAHERGVIHRDLKPGNILLQSESQSSSHFSPGSGTETAQDSEPIEPTASLNDKTFKHSPPDLDKWFANDPSSSKQFPGSTVASQTPSHHSNDSTLNPRIADFGLAKRIDADSNLTSDGRPIGSPGYMPPEQARGQIDQIGPQSDVYSLGAIFYSTLTGHPPFQASTVMETMRNVCEKDPIPPRKLNPSVDRDLETICLKCLEKQPAHRYATAGDLARDLGRFLDGRTIMARPEGLLRRSWRWCRRKPAWAAFAASVVVLILTLGLGGWNYALQQANLRKIAETSEQHALARRDAARAAGISNDTIDVMMSIFRASEIAGNPVLRRKMVRDSDRMVKYFEKTIEDLQDEPERALEYATYLIYSGRLHRLLSEAQKAEEDFRVSIKALDSYVPNRLVDRIARQKLAGSAHFYLAVVLRLQGKQELAIAAQHDSLRIRQKKIGNTELTTGQVREISLNYQRLGRLYLEQRRNTEARKHILAALKLRLRLVETAGRYLVDDRRDLAATYNNLSVAYGRLCEPDMELQSLRDSQKIVQFLSQQFAGEADFQVRYGESYSRLASHYRERGNSEKALKNYRRAEALIAPVLKRLPNDGGFRISMRNLHTGIARTYHQDLFQFGAAVPHWMESIRFNDFSSDHMKIYSALNGALEIERLSAQQNKRPNELFQIATWSAEMVKLVSDTKFIPERERKLKVNQHIGFTFEFLELALKAGYFDFAAHRTAFVADTRFDPIRNEPRFYPFLKRVFEIRLPVVAPRPRRFR